MYADLNAQEKSKRLSESIYQRCYTPVNDHNASAPEEVAFNVAPALAQFVRS